MHLIPEQIAAAEISGCSFRPATPAEVQRLSMQRRVFFIDGLPVLATRGDGFFETVGTLEKLIAEGRQVLQFIARTAPVAPLPMASPEPAVAPTVVPDPMQMPEVAEPEVETAPPVVRIRRPRRVKPISAPIEPEPFDDAPVAAVEAPDSDASVRPVRSAVRARENPNPRWMTAGAARRGRATVHWSSRAR